MGGDWLEFRSDLVFVFVGFVGVAVSVLVLVRIFSGGGWLVGLVVSGDIFFFLVVILVVRIGVYG